MEQVAQLVDPILTRATEQERIPGIAFVAVKNGSVLYAKGYGYADLQNRIPVDPARTLFYLASATKPFTATAVMQLVEQGSLELNRDVNQYLSEFKLAGSDGSAVTLAHLLTHTAGFDDRNIGYVARSPNRVLELGEYLRLKIPPRVIPAGTVTAYSNFGYGLAGRLVEIASGMPYRDYIERRIFAPLGMTRSTAQCPPHPEFLSDLAKGYHYDFLSERMEPQTLGYRNLPPAGTISSTPLDMARFLVAHLQDGGYGDARILRPETVRAMHSRQFTHHPKLPGNGYGFYEFEHAGLKVLGHEGGYIGFSTLLIIIPEDQLGLFVASNTTSASLKRKVLEPFLDRFYPAANDHSKASVQPGSPDLERFAGTYQNTRYSRDDIEKIAILDSQIEITAAEGRALLLQPRNQPASRWIQMEPLFFRNSETGTGLAFREDSRGRITYMFSSLGTSFPTAFERLRWHDTLSFNLPLMFALLLVFVSSFTAWPLASVFRLILRKRFKKPWPAGDRYASGFAVVSGILGTAFLMGVDAMIGNSQYRQTLVYGMTREMVALLWVPIVMIPPALLILYFACRAWREHTWLPIGRLYYSIVAVAQLIFLAFVAHWHLLGFQY